MTEQEYIDTTDRVKISNARQILSDICPENSSVIDIENFRVMMKLLAEWEEQLFDKTETTD
jgi:hypothetical protein